MFQNKLLVLLWKIFHGKTPKEASILKNDFVPLATDAIYDRLNFPLYWKYVFDRILRKIKIHERINYNESIYEHIIVSLCKYRPEKPWCIFKEMIDDLVKQAEVELSKINPNSEINFWPFDSIKENNTEVLAA